MTFDLFSSRSPREEKMSPEVLPLAKMLTLLGIFVPIVVLIIAIYWQRR